ncbi:early nodulin-like protein 9 [Nicotiana tabacum]|uniref:Early nodulin-like protein 1 n=1 Tax=Nicotiana tabacum TaxID=4097 RepID=A0A1S3ZC64_TOBAC|nr:early nodulin-like protein 1 [Nicotiana tomentosiformis]XP_016461929.1 PREDICTED: early nodulin-like protein 1 [Nicotiana tabacum]
MAQTSSRSSRNVFNVLGLLSLFIMFQNANSFEFKVGGSGDWSVPSYPNSYNQWAERSRFQIGDSLSFNYPADKDSVLLVNKADYDNCNTASPIEKYSDGHSVVKFNQSGPFYFISGVHDNCVKNEKLHAVVMADRSNRNQTAASPPPSPSADEVPPSPAPSGEEAPSPPTGSVEINPTAAPSQESSPPKNGASSIAVSFVGSTTAFIGSLFLLGF